MEDFKEAYNYFRNIYKKIEEQDIIEFEKKYRNGPEEEEDLIDFFKR
jgi:DnaJ family protein C protein 9